VTYKAFGANVLIAFALGSMVVSDWSYGGTLLESPQEAAATLKSLTLEPNGMEVKAVIAADGMLEHRVYLLEDPPQVVLDIINVLNPLGVQRPRQPHALLERVRAQELPMSAYLPRERKKTFGRFIFELKQPAQYWIRVEPGNLILGLFPRDQEPTLQTTANGGSSSAEPREEAPVPNLPSEHEEDTPVEPGLESTKTTQTRSGAASDYRIEPEDVDPAVFFGSGASDREQYLIGPEDVLDVNVFELDQLNRTVRVLADGNINLPLIGLINVQGLTSTQVSERVAGKLQNRYVQNPQVNVLVKEFKSRQVSLLGAVARPATYPLAGRRNLLQLIADAGGLSSNAGGVLYVFRQLPDGESARLSIPLNELLIEGNPRWNIWLAAGDIISIPPEEAISVSILGAVRNPGNYKLPVGDGASLLRAIAIAGGLNDRASKRGVQVKRRADTGEETIMKVDFGKILSGEAPDVILQEGDVIVVKESFF
jgi:polysaccharide export outer membrane protein